MISLSTSAVVAILYQLVWPWIAGLLILLLIALWSFRSERPRLYAVLLIIEIVGSIPAGIYWASERNEHLQWSQEVEYWNSVSNAANTGNVAEALRLLATRENGLRSYVERSVGELNDASSMDLMRAAFKQCVDLLDNRTDSISTLLDEAVSNGHPDIIKAWLDSPPCANLPTSREEGISSILKLVVPYTTDDTDVATRQLRGRQAEALRTLVEQYPALADVPLSEDCGKNRRDVSICPTLVMVLLEKWHQEGVAAVLPFDARAAKHLPSVVFHVLRGEAREAATSAKADPETFHRHLPNLMATAPLESLRAALRAAPPDEMSLLSPKEGDTLYQHLSPLFNAAKRRDAEQANWHFLWVLLDLFSNRLREVDTSLYSRYVIGTSPGDANLERLMDMLRSAGVSCDGFRHLASWGGSPGAGDERQWYQQRSGCVTKAEH